MDKDKDFLKDFSADDARAVIELVRMYQTGKTAAIWAIVTAICGALLTAIGIGVAHWIRTVALVIVAALIVIGGAGCKTTEQLAAGIAEKSLAGSGTVAIQSLDIDPSTGSPRATSKVITGKYASAKQGDYALQYSRRKSPSIWAWVTKVDAIEEETQINFVGTKEGFSKAEKMVQDDINAANAGAK